MENPTQSSGTQTALVTGASVGIGLEIARLLAADGYKLVLVARDEARLKIAADEMRSVGAPDVRILARDLSAPDACRELADELAADQTQIDILINNAGFGVQGKFHEADLQKQLQLIGLNIAALTEMTHLFLPSMIARSRGRIMNLASVAGFLPGPLMACYYASKAYVLSFSMALSEECAATGVTITCVCPGSTKTEFFTRAGIPDARIANAQMTAKQVALIGYTALLRGRPLVVTGMANKAIAQATRLLPRMLLARIAHKRNQKRSPG